MQYVWKLARHGFAGKLFLLGLMFGAGSSDTPVYMLAFAALWFFLPGSIIFGALNDAFDHETDKLNPRKQSVELTAALKDKQKLLLICIGATLSVVVLSTVFTPTVWALYAVWVLTIVLYCVPPLRFKSSPYLSIFAGGIGCCVPPAIMGYVLSAGMLPSYEYIILGSLLMAGTHMVYGEALDLPYDKAAGVDTLAIRLGSQVHALLFGCFLWGVMLVYGLMLGLYEVVLFAAVFPVYTLYEIYRGSVQSRSVYIYKNLQTVSWVFWCIVITWYIWF